jgi:hypothetical protein
MINYREFEAGPDPFGRKYLVLFKWLQTAISIRHSDTVDVRYVLSADDAGPREVTIALPHADLLRVSRDTSRKLDDPWCARLATRHLLRLISTGEDLEKELVTVNPADLRRYADELAAEERTATQPR